MNRKAATAAAFPLFNNADYQAEVAIMNGWINGLQLAERWEMLPSDLVEYLKSNVSFFDDTVTPYDDNLNPIDAGMLSISGLDKTWYRLTDIEEDEKRTNESTISFLLKNGIGEKEAQEILSGLRTSLTIQNPAICNNCFIRNGEFWEVIYNGNKGIVKHLAGLQYIAYLLERPGEAISCINLSHAVNPSESTPMSNDKAAAEQLYIATNSRLVHANKERPATKKILYEKYKELLGGLDNAESELEREETEAEMKKILQSIRSEDKIPDTINSKAQANIKKSIDRAYTAIEKAGMNDLSIFLNDHINPNGKYGYIYTGAPWEIRL
jgi:hypothetical protein